MAKTIDPGLAARLREESEQTKEVPFPSGVAPTRPNRLRSKVYSVRLSAEEQARVQRVADAKHLPASTLVRSWILERLDQEKSAWTRPSRSDGSSDGVHGGTAGSGPVAVSVAVPSCSWASGNVGPCRPTPADLH